MKSCFAKVCGGVVAGRVRLNLGGNRSTMSSASRHDSSRRCDENVLVTTGISGSSEMIVDAQETKVMLLLENGNQVLLFLSLEFQTRW